MTPEDEEKLARIKKLAAADYEELVAVIRQAERDRPITEIVYRMACGEKVSIRETIEAMASRWRRRG